MTHSSLFVKRVNSGCSPNCEKRMPGCHDHCKAYQENKRINEEYKPYIKSEKEKRRILDVVPPKDRDRRR